MKHRYGDPDPHEAAQLSDFGDALVSGTAPEPRTDIEATMARVHRALGVEHRAGAAMPTTLKRAIWEDKLLPTTISETPPLPEQGQAPARKAQQRSIALSSPAHVAHRWQAAISLALVLIVLGGLVGIVTQRGGLIGYHDQPMLMGASPTMAAAEAQSSLPVVPATCVANGTIISNAELETKSITNWPTPQYTPVQRATNQQGLAIQQTFLSFQRCEWNALHSATPPATPEPPVEAAPVLLTYFSDRLRYDRLYNQLSPAQQSGLNAYRCRPVVKQLLASFPLPVNQPLTRAKVESTSGNAASAFEPIFAPSDVYRLPDGRFGAIVGTISTAALTHPTAVTPMDTLQFFAFTEVNGRYYIDELFTLVSSDMSQLTLNGRNGSLSTHCP